MEQFLAPEVAHSRGSCSPKAGSGVKRPSKSLRNTWSLCSGSNRGLLQVRGKAIESTAALRMQKLLVVELEN